MKKKIVEIGVIIILFLGSISATSGCTQEQEELLYSNNNNQTTTTQENYVIVDTGQNSCFDNSEEISYPEEGGSFYGQDAQYYGNQPSYQDNGDGTVTDLNTGLMWVQDPGEKMSYDEAVVGVDSFNLAGYTDWRVPNIKELYSLMDFRGTDPNPMSSSSAGLTPFIDIDYFVCEYGDTSSGERIIDSQWVTTSVYESTVMDGNEGFFGVNFVDGRIKCYPTADMKTYFVRYIRGEAYGINNFVDNGDGTIADQATGLVWQKADSGRGMNWEDALSYTENLNLGEYDDWRLPNAKELQSIMDYSRCPDTTDSAAIDPIFEISSITNEGGEKDYPFFWTSTTHIKYPNSGASAAYLSFGRALGYWNNRWQDVHGAGAQRSDPKIGDPDDYPYGHGPQGDAIRIYNYVRCVRGGLSDNQAPEKPETPDGPSSGGSGAEYTYSSSTRDLDGDSVYYWFDWGDNTNSGWLGLYESGEIVTTSHIWDSRGSYEIRVKAKDSNGAQSEWSDPLPISMPRSKYLFNQLLIKVIEQHPRMFPLLRQLLELN